MLYESSFYYVICVILTGIVTGSFLNVCIYRIPRHMSVNGNHGRSMCPACQKTLRTYDLIPVLSFCLLGGKCRFCKAPISFRYPAVEITNALLWVMSVWMFGFTAKAAVGCLFCSVLLTLSMIDWDTQEIPYRFQVIILCLGILSLFVPGFSGIKERLIGAAIISVPMILITLLCNGFGGGDIQLMAVSGFLLGFKAILIAMIIGTILAGAFSVIVMRIKKNRKLKIPFGPFLSIGLVCALFWGELILKWYLSFY